VTTFGEIFLEYFWNILEKFSKKSLNLSKKNSYYFIKVHVKNLVKNVIFKKIEIHLQVLSSQIYKVHRFIPNLCEIY
jgi:hypothetical protein